MQVMLEQKKCGVSLTICTNNEILAESIFASYRICVAAAR
ncbi:hypothetical protein Y11_08881 [Yersinia enterocolitica subsp. palearctica Y11]|uniref:Uncharacterized protein n=1 Tax=Yersinia enterocolitica subsp. palearctica serotype O:3 (strain DSM 13030 / CIP 106945 / Y11) TaxID=930944 RepID=A0A0H3NQG1_YERE1|nr:hypothetical protein Y11_08881 [Yersinia enterocolitica subsp. palearctica Y11]CCO68596.1 hypothetical protein D322_1722 [Yersinia enterocolitica IP 10393]